MPGRRRAIRLLLSVSAVLAGLLLLLGSAGAQDSDRGIAYSIELSGTVDPATQEWLGSELENAADEGAEVAIIRIDTPGGLDSSMREMVQDIIAAPMPVIVYVSPDGARAASAGLFIVQAADGAAMAPQTNIGSATPISIGGGDIDDKVLGRKIRNDAAAFVRRCDDCASIKVMTTTVSASAATNPRSPNQVRSAPDATSTEPGTTMMRKVQAGPSVTIAHHFRSFATVNSATPAAATRADGAPSMAPSMNIARKAAGYATRIHR